MATVLRCPAMRAVTSTGRQAFRGTALTARPATAARAQQRQRLAVSADAMKTESVYSTSVKGAPESLEYRLFFKQKGADISPWHDIPLQGKDGTYNFVCEIPKETAAKMEVATDEEKTPIKQDIKKGKLRFYPYNINWNYGLLPQTWEDPAHKNEDAGGVFGDNDPVDVVEIGSRTLEQGGVYPVKPLGVFAMIDDGELDWKIIAIAADDPKAASLNDVEDVEREMPGELEKIRVWFRDYKTPDGKPQNSYGYNDECLNKEFTIGVIEETHGFWNKLRSGERENSEELALQ
jgi:inorganic pyrophosphatase